MIDDEHERHSSRYERAGHDVVLSIERQTLGTDYGANGYTTLAEGNHLGELVALGPDHVLLDVGSGCGWPGLHLARTRGSSVIGVDPVVEGALVARKRAGEDDMTDQALAVVGSGTALPVRAHSIDAIVHSDML